MFFLEVLASEGVLDSGATSLGPLLAVIAAFFFIFLIIFIALYIYLSLAYTAIGRKANLTSPGVAWIPSIGPIIIAFRAAKTHWWPWLLLLGYVFVLIPVLFISLIGIAILLVFCIFVLTWHWKMFVAIKKPGWWAILLIIPVVNLVILGIAAWSKTLNRK